MLVVADEQSRSRPCLDGEQRVNGQLEPNSATVVGLLEGVRNRRLIFPEFVRHSEKSSR